MKKLGLLFPALILLTACNRTLPAQLSPDNRSAEFESRFYDGGEIQPQTLTRAAGIAQRRGFEYFTLETKQPESSSRPRFTVDYGRNPNGFGDAGASTPNGLNAGITARGANRTQWLVRFYNGNDRPSHLNVYSTKEILNRR